MFQVKCNGGFPKRRPICSGVTFGIFGTPIEFEVNTQVIQGALIVKFNIVDDYSKPAVYLESGGVNNGYLLDVNFYNITKNGSASISQPLGLVTVEDVELQINVYVDRIQGSNGYRLTYEFLEADMSRQTT